MSLFFVSTTASEPLFRGSESLPTSYIGYIFLVLLALIGVYIGILLLLKKLGVIKALGPNGNTKDTKILHRSKLNQNANLIHFEYKNKEYLIVDNGSYMLDLSSRLEETLVSEEKNHEE